MFKKVKEHPLNYWEEKSYMLVIPPKDNDDYINNGLKRISKDKDIKVIDNNLDVQKGCVNLELIYEEETYEVSFYPGSVSVPEYYLGRSFYFSEEEKVALLKAEKCLTIFMEFKSNPQKSFSLQLKLATILVPDLIGIVDESAENILPAKWVMMTAKSKVLPNPHSLFTVQSVMDKDGKVWLHTHGLARCGITELEILDSDRENYENHYDLLSTYAIYLLDKKNKNKSNKGGDFIGRLVNSQQVVVTSRSWTQGIKEYKHLKIGGLKDRKDGHNSKTSIIFLYKNKEDEENGVLSKVSIYNELWGENPLYFFSDEETFRMKKLAIERFSYVKRGFENKENSILLKIGLPLKDKGKFEHIWFELLEIKKDKLKVRLTQEPYADLGMHTDDVAYFTKDDVTDWIIYTKYFSVNPDNAYLLDIDI